jgi:geranyl-CoA carboxylase alpha subunit
MEDAAIAAVLQYELARDEAMSEAVDAACMLINWSSATPITTPYAYANGDDSISLAVTPQSTQTYAVAIGEKSIEITLIKRDAHTAQISINGDRINVLFNRPGPAGIELSIDGRTHSLINLNAIYASAEDAAGAGSVLAPMHGALLEVIVKKGDAVSKGQRLAILEAMKMQHEILAGIDGTVQAVHVEAGSQIAADTLMIEIEGDDA